MSALLAHPYPGHVRQLDNHIQRGVAMAENGVIHPQDLGVGSEDWPVAQVGEAPAISSLGLSRNGKLDQELADLERRRLVEALTTHPNNQKAAAQTLGLTPRALRYRLAKYGLNR